MFRAPINRSMRTLDRAFFRKTVALAAARVPDRRAIGAVKTKLARSKDLCVAPRVIPVRSLPAAGSAGWERVEAALKGEGVRWDLSQFGVQGKGKGGKKGTSEGKGGGDEKDKEGKEVKAVEEGDKCVLLDEKIRPDDDSTWSATVKRLVEAKTVEVRPYNLLLNYDYWTYEDIISSMLPEESAEEAPSGYSQVGHVAHFNLRDEYLPYRYLIAEILMDKHPNIRTVINKIDDVGSHSAFRTFDYELLRGSPDLNVTVREQGCNFSFNYASVYWNPRLGTEHARLVSKFSRGQAIADVMAGAGPFAIPAARNTPAFVWANDLNPHGYEMLQANARANKCSPRRLRAFNADGRVFIRDSAHALAGLAAADATDSVPVRTVRDPRSGRKRVINESMVSPRTFDHYVMNLPATAIDFLDAFVGLYAGREDLFAPGTGRPRPLVHAYCFAGNSGVDGDLPEKAEICARIGERLGCEVRMEDEGLEMEIYNVRLVAPNKQMFCASFRMPAEVLFRR